VSGGTGGNGEGVSRPDRRKETLSILDLDFASFATGSTETCSPAVVDLGAMVPDSSTDGNFAALDLVAERRLCSREDRNLLKVFSGAVDLSGEIEEEVEC
jgi:hypothetical protein